MQKVILDTNVLVSALIQKSYPYYILQELYLEGKISLCLSDALMEEYYEVLNRDKFAKYADFKAKAEIVLADIHRKALFFHPQATIQVIKDPDDNMLLELAEESGAEYLITGNINDFTMNKYKQTAIVSPKDYWELYRQI